MWYRKRDIMKKEFNKLLSLLIIFVLIINTFLIHSKYKAYANEGDIKWDEEIIYFLLTDRFSNGDPSNDDPYNLNYDKNQLESYHGGDFQGIIDNISYLKDLGITTIWITPIVKNIPYNVGEDNDIEQYSYHGYWAEDFTKIDPHLGDIDKFKEMLDILHENDIKLMVDVVLNHVGYGAENEEQFRGMIREKPGGDPKTEYLSGLADFETENPEVRKKIIDWQSSWIEKTKTDKGNTIDYFRLDTVKHLDEDTIIEFSKTMKSIDPNFRIIGEYFNGNVYDNGGYLGKEKLDSLLDFYFKNIIKDYINGSIIKGEKSLTQRNELITDENLMGQFLSSHDEDGFLITSANNDKALFKIAISLQLTSKGQVVIYYGEELGQSGLNANFNNGRFSENRKDFPWGKIEEEKDLLNHYKKLIQIRKDNKEIFSKGERNTIYASDEEGIGIFERKLDKEKILIGLNINNDTFKKNIKTNLKGKSKLIDIYNDNEYEVSKDGTVDLIIPGKNEGGTSILVIKENIDNKNSLAFITLILIILLIIIIIRKNKINNDKINHK